MQNCETNSYVVNLNPLMITKFKRASKILEKTIIENKYPSSPYAKYRLNWAI